MNKYQEALRIIKSTKLYRAGKLVKDIGELRKEEIETLQGLVDKATPKKPLNAKEDESGYPTGTCPSCGNELIAPYACFNNDCRQAIDWSNDDSTD